MPIKTSSIGGKDRSKKAGGLLSSKLLATTMAVLITIQFILILSQTLHVNQNQRQQTLQNEQRGQHAGTTKEKMASIASFWWPSPETSGGFLSAIYNAQNPDDCSSKSTKYFVMQSLKKNEGDNRGLSAWASITMQHMLHAFSDGDDPSAGRRVLINDNNLWPMAKGCKNGPETRECYFLPLTKCRLSDVDPIDAKDGSVALIDQKRDDYDRSARTVYSSDTNKYARMTENKIEWTGLPGNQKDHSLTALTAAFLAYNLQPQPWLRKEIDERLMRSLPADLNPDRTLGVPIRRSDKCFGHAIAGSAKGELDCPPLETYLQSVRDFMKFDPLIDTIIVISEDNAACSEFIKLVKKEIPSLRIVTNVGDVQQGTGSASKLESYKEGASNADVIASALTSLHLHLRARYFVLTTKSSWTSSIAILARVYGFSTDVYVIDIGKNKNSYSDSARRGG
mmetsp:Transcript_9589/g.19889  ORF Transcript_9589/g.19889 Transcript_9589/m.19889 type:complete len:452 (+) Transcript_9589:200-1555(+)